MRNRTLIFALLLPAAVVTSYGQGNTLPFAGPNVVLNGSFEDLRLTWMETTCAYMSVFAGAKTIPGWTVTAGTVNELVWAKTPTCDRHTAAGGTFFLDLTGFGADSPNGGVQQTLRNLTVGQQYVFSMAVISPGTLPLVTVDAATILLHAGPPFTKGTDIWTPEVGFFIAQSANPVLTIQNQVGGQQINFIDNVAVRAR